MSWCSSGCKSNDQGTEPELTPREMLRPQPAQAATAVVVAEGPLPLVYLAGSASPVRVLDRTSGRAIARGFAEKGSLVRVDARGVRIGEVVAVSSGLPADRSYAIELDLSGGPGSPPPPPATGPATD